MRNFPAPLVAHLQQETTTVAYLWRIVRVDGVSYHFTSHHADIIYGGNTYVATAGVDPTSIVRGNRLQVNNLDLNGFLDAITAEDLHANLFEHAEVTLYLINYTAPSDGAGIMLAGRIGAVSWGDTGYSAEFRGLTQHFSQSIVELISPECRATFGDARCKVNLATYTHTGTVSALSDRKNLTLSSYPAGTKLRFGKITFTSGACAGYSMEITKQVADTGQVELFLPMHCAFTAGDAYSAVEGCDGTDTRCKEVGNIYNFRGEQFVPGTDKLLERPEPK